MLFSPFSPDMKGTDNMIRHPFEEQLDIISEATALLQAAERRNYDITFEQALEVLKIRRLEMIYRRIDVLSNVIHDTKV